MCAMQACSVCECEEAEVPAPWLAQEKCSGGSCDRSRCAAEHDAVVNRTVEPQLQVAPHGWRCLGSCVLNTCRCMGAQDGACLCAHLREMPWRQVGRGC